MAKKEKKAKKEKTSSGSKKGKKFLFILVCIVGTIFLKMSFVLLFFGMLPAMAAYIFDRDKYKYIFCTVAAMNLSGLFPFLFKMVMQGGGFEVGRAVLSDPLTWLVIYSAAAIGWILIWTSPIVAAAALGGIYKGRVMRLEGMQKKLEEEWGEEVRGA